MRAILILCTICMLLSCNNETEFKTDPNDYNQFLSSNKPSTSSKHYELWNRKITSDSSQTLGLAQVANEYGRYFRKTGDIEYLKKAERALFKAYANANINKENYARALSRNYISQHRFKEALDLAEEANQIGGGKENTKALLFDIHMELGHYKLAKGYLNNMASASSFGYLIRAAKWNDYKGDLDTTIDLMENAMAKAESSNNWGLRIWSYTNIADYYGHAGRIADSYSYYLKALELDPQDAYAKKGIAWILFSHEKNGEEALRILNSITTHHPAPDYYMLKAEIHDYLGNKQGKSENIEKYAELTKNTAYGPMYNIPNTELLLEKGAYQAALHLAREELKNRMTPETQSLLAKTYLRMGRVKEALKIVEDQVLGKTFEPAILLNMAQIYQENGHDDKVSALKEELLGAIYELGPNSLDQIRAL